jgi:hypothetical protein
MYKRDGVKREIKFRQTTGQTRHKTSDDNVILTSSQSFILGRARVSARSEGGAWEVG